MNAREMTDKQIAAVWRAHGFGRLYWRKGRNRWWRNWWDSEDVAAARDGVASMHFHSRQAILDACGFIDDDPKTFHHPSGGEFIPCGKCGYPMIRVGIKQLDWDGVPAFHEGKPMMYYVWMCKNKHRLMYDVPKDEEST